MKVAPLHPDAEKAAREAGEAFRPRAEEARQLAAEARAAAEAAGARELEPFKEGAALEKQGQQALQARQAASAARAFLDARLRFERAARAARKP
jgi:hypothetical protein